MRALGLLSQHGFASSTLADPRHHQALSSAIEGTDKVLLDGRAVSSVSGDRVTFYMSEDSPGISGLSAFPGLPVAVGTVETVALRDVLDDEHVQLLKIDTEGFGLFVLQGYPFERSHPDVIMAEFEDHKTVPLGYRFAFASTNRNCSNGRRVAF